MATISGTFLSKVFEGPYGNMRKWIEEMKAFVQSQGKSPQKLYLLLHHLPQVREETRQELRGDPGPSLSRRRPPAPTGRVLPAALGIDDLVGRARLAPAPDDVDHVTQLGHPHGPGATQ